MDDISLDDFFLPPAIPTAQLNQPNLQLFSAEQQTNDNKRKSNWLDLALEDDEIAQFLAPTKPKTIPQIVITFDSLPTDVQQHIFSHLSVKDIARCSRVCKKWQNECWKGLHILDLSQTSNMLTKRTSFNENMLIDLLRKAPQVTYLNTWGCELCTDRTLEALANIYATQQITSENSNGTGSKTGPSIAHLILRFSSVTPLGMKHVVHFTNLKTLEYNPGITDKEVLFIIQLTKLEHLRINFSLLSDKALAAIANKLPKLKELHLSGCERISDMGISHLSHLHDLQTLNLSFTAVSGAGLKYLSTLPHLRTLMLTSTKLTDDGLTYISRMVNLRFLNLGYCSELSDYAIENMLKAAPKLMQVNVTACKCDPQKLSSTLMGFGKHVQILACPMEKNPPPQ